MRTDERSRVAIKVDQDRVRDDLLEFGDLACATGNVEHSRPGGREEAQVCLLLQAHPSRHLLGARDGRIFGLKELGVGLKKFDKLAPDMLSMVRREPPQEGVERFVIAPKTSVLPKRTPERGGARSAQRDNSNMSGPRSHHTASSVAAARAAFSASSGDRMRDGGLPSIAS